MRFAAIITALALAGTAQAQPVEKQVEKLQRREVVGVDERRRPPLPPDARGGVVEARVEEGARRRRDEAERMLLIGLVDDVGMAGQRGQPLVMRPDLRPVDLEAEFSVRMPALSAIETASSTLSACSKSVSAIFTEPG